MKSGPEWLDRQKYLVVNKLARRTRCTHTPAFKARVALAILRADKTLAELCNQFKLHTN